MPGFTAHHETLAYQMPELGPGAQSVGDHVLRTRCRLIPGCRMSRQAGRHSHLRCAYRPARRDPRWPRDSALRLRPFHRTSSCLCRISLTQDFTPGLRYCYVLCEKHRFFHCCCPNPLYCYLAPCLLTTLPRKRRQWCGVSSNLPLRGAASMRPPRCSVRRRLKRLPFILPDRAGGVRKSKEDIPHLVGCIISESKIRK